MISILSQTIFRSNSISSLSFISNKRPQRRRNRTNDTERDDGPKSILDYTTVPLSRMYHEEESEKCGDLKRRGKEAKNPVQFHDCACIERMRIVVSKEVSVRAVQLAAAAGRRRSRSIQHDKSLRNECVALERYRRYNETLASWDVKETESFSSEISLATERVKAPTAKPHTINPREPWEITTFPTGAPVSELLPRYSSRYHRTAGPGHFAISGRRTRPRGPLLWESDLHLSFSLTSRIRPKQQQLDRKYN